MDGCIRSYMYLTTGVYVPHATGTVRRTRIPIALSSMVVTVFDCAGSDCAASVRPFAFSMLTLLAVFSPLALAGGDVTVGSSPTLASEYFKSSR